MIMEGPYGKFGYRAGGTVIITESELEVKEFQCKRLFMIAGGAGITPLYQALMEITNMKEETIELVLFFANRTEEDIIFRKELEERGDRIKIHYILSQPP